jgi:DNA invertase Pin-like site-specific DNA recombinase
VKQDVSDEKPASVQTPWRDELLGLLKTENTEQALGFNAGLRAAISLLEQHEQDRQQRSASALQQRKAEGKKTGGDVPYGYELGPDGETLRECPAEQRVIAAARKLRATPYSLREVARRLKARNMFPREGATFHAAQIKRMTDEET